MSPRRILALAVIVAAAWVNYPYVAAWLEGEGKRTWIGDGEAPPEEPAALPSPSAETVAVFAPVVRAETLVDPFVHEESAALAVAAPVQEILPQVTLILLSGGSRRAVVDGRTVGVGDRVAIGTVQAIDARTVTVARPTGTSIKLALPSSGKRKTRPKAIDPDAVDLPEVPEEKR